MGRLADLAARFKKGGDLCPTHEAKLAAALKRVHPSKREEGRAALLEAVWSQFYAQHPSKDQGALRVAVSRHDPPCPVCFEGGDVVLHRALKQLGFATAK